MTVHHYIASSTKIPTGSFWGKRKIVPITDVSNLKIKGLTFEKAKENKYKKLPLQEKDLIVYETEADFLSKIGVIDLDGYEEIKSQFMNPFVYHLHCSDSRIGYRTLFGYIDEHLSIGEKMELYTCLDGDELKQKKDGFHILIDLNKNTFSNQLGIFKLNEKRLYDDLSERFSMKEQQYSIVVK